MFLPSNTQKGFSLVELLVSISIMVLITSIVVVSQHGYNNSQILKNAADVLALDIRTAQIYGTGVRESSPGNGDFNSPFGAALGLYPLPDAQKGYILFADQTPKDGFYDNSLATCIDECQSRTKLPPDVTITSMCFVDTIGHEDCSSLIYRFDITFARPDPEPIIKWDGAYDMSTYTGFTPDGVRIKLTSATTGEEHSVTLYTTGQISVQ